jgi:adenylate kinase
MASSIQLEQQRLLKEQKKLDRAREREEMEAAELAAVEKKRASDERIAKKMAIIEAGGVVPNPKPKKAEKPVEEQAKEKVAKKKVAKKKVAKKKVAKKRGRPKKK